MIFRQEICQLKASGAQYTTHILSLFIVNEHIGDRLILVKCILLSAVVNSVVSSFVLSHSCLSHLENPPTPLEFQSYSKYPHSFGFPVQRTTLALRVPKSHAWYSYGYFLESPITFEYHWWQITPTIMGFWLVYCIEKFHTKRHHDNFEIYHVKL